MKCFSAGRREKVKSFHDLSICFTADSTWGTTYQRWEDVLPMNGQSDNNDKSSGRLLKYLVDGEKGKEKKKKKEASSRIVQFVNKPTT